jgi:glycosyltransferase involved in cell wall biosynthesis
MAQSGTEIFIAVQGRGVALKPGVPDEFAEAIQKLSQSKELIGQYGKAARQFAVEKLDKEIILQRFQRQFMGA